MIKNDNHSFTILLIVLISSCVSSEGYRSPEWIEMTGYHTGAVHSVLMMDGVTQLGFAGTSQFTMKKDEIIHPLSFSNPSSYANYYSSVVKRVLNNNIVIACGAKHITMLKDDGTIKYIYNGQGNFSHELQCSFTEISLNKYLFAYYDTISLKNTIEILKYDTVTKAIINIELYQQSGYNTMIICNTFSSAMMIFCVYSNGSALRGQLYNFLLQPFGSEIITKLLSQHTYYQLFPINTNTLLLFGAFKYAFFYQKITFNTSLIIGNPIKIYSLSSLINTFSQIIISPIKDQTMMITVRTATDIFISKMVYNSENIGFELKYATKLSLEHLTIGLFDSFNYVLFGSYSGQLNYMYFIREATCNDVDIYVNINQSIVLTGLTKEKDIPLTEIKNIALINKNPTTIPETPVFNSSLFNPVNIITFTFSINKTGIYYYNYYIFEGNQGIMPSPQCTMSVMVCFDSCQECSKTIAGTFLGNQCTICKDGFFFDATNPTNCGLGCDPLINYHYYYNENKILQCLPYPGCPPEYHFKVGDTFECEADCNNHNMIGDKTTDKCVFSCPINTFYNIIANTCDEIVVCTFPEYISLNQKGCVTKEELEKEMKDIMNNLDDDILYLDEYYDNITVGNSTIEIIDPLDPDRTPSRNLSDINLGFCEKILMDAYDIFPPDKLIILKKDTNNNNTQTNIVEYVIYSSKGEKLDLKLCDKTPPNIKIPINDVNSKEYQGAKEMAKKGINIFNDQDNFFQSICYSFSSDEDRDIPRTIRIKEILQDNSTFCPQGCTIKGINYTDDTVDCGCAQIKPIKPDTITESPLESIKKSAINALTQGNWQVFLCAHKVFSKTIFPGNIGNYFILIIVLILIVDICFFVIQRTQPIQSYLLNLYDHFEPRNSAIPLGTNGNNQNTNEVLDFHKQLKLRHLSSITPNNITQSLVSVFIPVKQPIKKASVTPMNTMKTFQHFPKNRRMTINGCNDVCGVSPIAGVAGITATTTTFTTTTTTNNNVTNTINGTTSAATRRAGKHSTMINIINKADLPQIKKIGDSTLVIKKRKLNKEITLDEYSDMEFDELFVKDYRTFCQHYWDYLQLTHPFINTFFTKSRKVLRTIKIALFFMGIAIDFTLNAFFYSDQYIAKNYLNKGKDTFWYNIPITAYTFLIGSVFTITLNKLSNSEAGISVIQQGKNSTEVLKLIGKFTKCYSIRLSFFFLFLFIIISIFWYYTTAFCAVYPNSQSIWFKNGAISIGISFGIPFIGCIIYAGLIQAGIKYHKKWCLQINKFILSLL